MHTYRLFSYDRLYTNNQLQLASGNIFQISELSMVKGGEVKDHIQLCDEITYAISGKADIISGNRCDTVSAGQIHYIKKGINHNIIADSDSGFRYICIGFLPNPENPDLANFICETENTEYAILNDDGNIRILSEMLINEIYNTDSQSNTMINLYITQILISLYRLLHGKTERQPAGNISSGFTIYHLLRYIDREYLNIENVKSISEKMAYNEYYLSHLFKEKMGISIKEYITKKKMITAANLLVTTNMTIREVSEQVNFASPHTFSQSFKKSFGTSPDQYRKTKTANFRG